MAKAKKTKKKKVIKKKKEIKKTTPISERSPQAAAPIKTVPMPTAGVKITDFESALDENIKPKAEHGGARPGSGRPAKQPEKSPADLTDNELIDSIGELLKMPFDIWAARTGLDLSLSNDEAEMIAKPTKTLLDHYAPDLSPVGVAWAGFTLSFVAIMRGRMVEIREYKTSLKNGDKPPSETGFVSAEQGGSAPTRFPTIKEVQPVEAK